MKVVGALEIAAVGRLVSAVATKQVLDFLTKWKIDPALLRKLRMLLLEVNAVLNHADERQVEETLVEAWLREVRDAAYDAEDLLDEISTDALESRLATGQVRSFVFDSLNASDSIRAGIDFKSKDAVAALNPFGQRVESKLSDLIGRLEDISKQKGVLGLQALAGNSSNTLRALVTTPSVDVCLVCGRVVERNDVIDLLVNGMDDDGKFHVIPIVGIGGIGKTTLAQIVYGDAVVKKHFGFRAWASVSDDFDEASILRSLIESLTQKTCDVKNLELLQSRVKTLLDDKKFLLVLDDVWNENAGNWQKLRVPFAAGAAGSRIIVTTRSRKVAAIMGTVPTYHLKELSMGDCWSLFERIVFPSRNWDAYRDLKAIGEDIVVKCKGLPLAARVLGGLCLSELDKKSWERILHSKMWNLQNSDILPALMLSYNHLPACIKRCFAYCSIFPKDYKFQKEMLVLLWMAEGFLPQSDGYETSQTMEDEGSYYFSDLVSRSFFQQCTGDNSRFMMHDLIHDLAQFVSGKTCLRLEGKMGTAMNDNIEKTRHSGYIRAMNDVYLRFEPISKVKCLRTFLPLDPLVGFNLSDLTNTVVHDVLPELRLLRVLSLRGYLITKLPDSISNLRHLRYLNVSHSMIKVLPESTSSLYNLQTLILCACRLLTRLPTEMGNLINLRHLDTTETDLQNMPPRMGKLIHLRTLSNFAVGKGSDGSGINELHELVHIQGALVISGLDNVSSIQDAIVAELVTKNKLDELVLEWSSSTESSRDVATETEVLDILQPHTKLKHLKIRYYGGAEFPSWMGDDSFTYLTSLHLSNCINCTSLPSVGQLPSLKNLIIEGMDGVNAIGDEFYKNDCSSRDPFPSLETLKFENMKEWEEWLSFGDGTFEVFPRLIELSIFKCPKLREFSHKFASLTKLRIKRCDAYTFSSVDNSGCEGFLSLRYLVLGNCKALHTLPSALPSLEGLEIDDCEKITTLPGSEKLRHLELLGSNSEVLGSIVDLSSLTFLHMSQVSNISSFPKRFLQMSSRLEELKIVGCGDLTCLSSQEMGLENLVSLRRLIISYCAKLAGLPDEGSKLPPFLELLDIKQCNLLDKLPSELYKLKSLEDVRIEGCLKLEYFPEMGLPLSLKRLVIQRCVALKCIPESMLTSVEYLEIRSCSSLKAFQRDIPRRTAFKHIRLNYCHSLTSLPEGLTCNDNDTLEILEIDNCSSLEAFPSGQLPASLKQLEISNCASLSRLPASLPSLTSLDRLDISDCPLLESFPEGGLPSNLTSFEVSDCERLNSLPSRIHSVKCLQRLSILNCPNLVSSSKQALPLGLQFIAIRSCEKLNLIYHWKLYKLTSLDSLALSEYQGLISFPNAPSLPRSITDLRIMELPDLESLSEGLQNLTSLKSLLIRGCAKLRSILPEKGLPSSLGSLIIRQCPLLKARYQQDNAEEWHKIAGIPFVELS